MLLTSFLPLFTMFSSQSSDMSPRAQGCILSGCGCPVMQCLMKGSHSLRDSRTWKEVHAFGIWGSSSQVSLKLSPIMIPTRATRCFRTQRAPRTHWSPWITSKVLWCFGVKGKGGSGLKHHLRSAGLFPMAFCDAITFSHSGLCWNGCAFLSFP